MIGRGLRTFEVVDDRITRSWNFWAGQFATGMWEPDTLAAIDRLLHAGDTYLDIGSWVGPTVLWAAQYAAQVIAVEPDPVAADLLEQNVALNPGLCPITVVRKAVAPDDQQGPVHLTSLPGGRLGDSCTSVVHNQHGGVMVAPTTLADLVAMAGTPIGLVKIDIEGGEGEWLPGVVDQLQALKCPIILSLHLQWLDRRTRERLDEAVHRFEVSDLDHSNTEFPTLVLNPGVL